MEWEEFKRPLKTSLLSVSLFASLCVFDVIEIERQMGDQRRGLKDISCREIVDALFLIWQKWI